MTIIKGEEREGERIFGLKEEEEEEEEGGRGSRG